MEQAANENLSLFAMTLHEIMSEIAEEKGKEAFQISVNELFDRFVLKGWSSEELNR